MSQVDKREAAIAVLDGIWNAGGVPRLLIVQPVPGVPESVATRFGAVIPIDLDPKYPLELAYTPEGIEVSLAFQGAVTRCTLSWGAIVGISGSTFGPEAVAPPAPPAAALPAKNSMGLRLIKGGKA